jgi:hypothetical protein
MKGRRERAERDQAHTPFNPILARLCDATGAYAAALVDAEGETVDYASGLDPFQVRVAAAEWRIVLGVLQGSRSPILRGTLGLCVRGRRQSFFIHSLADGYALALMLPRRAFMISARAVAQASRELQEEAGLALSTKHAKQPRWARVSVRSSYTAERTPRPDAIWLSERWSPVTILGRYQARDLSRSEVGYLARLESGAEVFLVREPLGRWFVDNVAALAVGAAPSADHKPKANP